jgi:hypothetical protein
MTRKPPDLHGFTVIDCGMSGLPLDEARAAWDAFRAKHPFRPLRKGQKSPAELVREGRDERADRNAPPPKPRKKTRSIKRP